MSYRSQQLYFKILRIIDQYPEQELTPKDVQLFLMRRGIQDRFTNLKRIEKLLWKAAAESKVSVAWYVLTGASFIKARTS